MQREGVANVVNWLIISIHASQHRMRRHHSRHDHFPFIISIHAPIVGCDCLCERHRQSLVEFQSTHPSWGATKKKPLQRQLYDISIHAPIVGCDVCRTMIKEIESNFNPRTHRGVRPQAHRNDSKRNCISIHAPIVGCDTIVSTFTGSVFYFNPRTHRGVRLVRSIIMDCFSSISIHAPIVGCDISYAGNKDDYSLFQSTHPSWGATSNPRQAFYK